MKFLTAITLVNLWLLIVAGSLHAATYYISLSGSDHNAGTSADQAWASIRNINTTSFLPGDSILFEGGSTFSGIIEIGPEDSGTAADPLVISSYGRGRATISSGESWGIYAYNAAGIRISNLIFLGSGLNANTSSGIEFFMDLPDTRLAFIEVDSVEISGYHRVGLIIGSWNGGSGYDDVKITNSKIYNCGEAGINSYAQATLGHTNFYVGNNKVYDIPGIADIKNHHSGSGIVIGGVDGALIEYCEIYNTGWLSTYDRAGPAGLWGYHCNNLVIQYNESHHNKTSSTKDGGGFDIDGGCTSCVIQYNYSHDNDGPGYLISQYYGAPRMKDIIIRYNISENDVRKNNYGAIHIWSSGASGGIQDVAVYNNTVYLTPSAEGAPKAVYLQSGGTYNVRFRNNILVATGGLEMIYVDKVTDVRFERNNYWTKGDPFKIRWGNTHYTSFEEWQQRTGQEEYKGKVTGLMLDPQLQDPGKGITISEPGKLPTLSGYKLQYSSELIGKALDQRQEWGIEIGERDFYGNSLDYSNALSIGAHQFTGDSKVCLHGGLVPLTFGKGRQGSYKGTGVVDETFFDPQLAGPGHHELSFSFVDQGEQNTVFHTVTVIDTKTTRWKGLENNSEEWFDSQNWTTCIPTSQIDAVISSLPAGPPDFRGAYPKILNDRYAQVNNLAATGTLALKGNGSLEINGHYQGGKLTADPDMTVILKSEKSQLVPSGSYGKLVLQGAGEKSLGGPVAVSEGLEMGEAKLYLDDYSLSIGARASIQKASPQSYVVTNGAGSLVMEDVGLDRSGIFPVGTEESYTPAFIENKGETDDFSVRVGDGVFRNGNEGSPLEEEWVDRTWYIKEEVAGGSDVHLSLQWNTADQQNLFLPANSYISQYMEGEWSVASQDAGYAKPLGDDAYIIDLESVTSFSYFAIGNRQGILPVVYTYFTAEARGAEAILKWETSQEKDNAGFTVEVSTDGQSYRSLGFVAAKGAKEGVRQQYSFRDLESGKYGKRYYRLLQQDVDGDYTYSEVRVLDFAYSGPAVSVDQNPFQNTVRLQVKAMIEGEMKVVITDLWGKLVLSKVFLIRKGPNSFDISPGENYSAGIYLFTVHIGEHVRQLKLIKK